MNIPKQECKVCGGSGKEINHLILGQKMREKRDKAGISLRDLAKQIGGSAPFLSDLEKGRRNWSEKWIQKYEKALS